MPAALRVWTPGGTPLYSWIETEVVRLGSADDCEVQIAGLEDHVVTLAYRDNQFAVINRSTEALMLDDVKLEPGTQRKWKEGGSLKLPGEVVVQLIRHRNPNFQAPESWRAMPDFEEPAIERKARREWRKQVAYFILAAMAIFMTGVFHTRQGPDAVEEAFQSVLTILADPHVELGHDANDRESRRITLDLLRTARSAEKASRHQAAKQAYAMVRDRLLIEGAQRSSLSWHPAVLNFIDARLEL